MEKGLFIWSSMQTESINEKHSLHLVGKYIDDSCSNVAIDIVNAILYGYEPEETEEERKEREIKDNMYKELYSYKILNSIDVKNIIEDLYDIAHGKKIN